jgi:hypothetical protein
MLQEMAKVGAESIVSWQPHGTAFRVHQPDVFARTVMRRYFKQTQYKSFQRQLHIYGFRRIGKGMDKGAYVHPMFVRDTKSMSLGMSCQKIKGKRNNKSGNAVHHRAVVDPDFYSSETSNVKNNDPNFQRKRSSNHLATALKADPTQSYPILLHACTATKENKKRGCSSEGAPPSIVVFTTTTSTDGRSTTADEEEKPLVKSSDLQKHGDEGFFAGKRFFYVGETKTPGMVEDFSAVVNRRERPMVFSMPRSA